MITFYAQDCEHSIFNYPCDCDEETRDRKWEKMKFINHVFLDGQTERGMDLVYTTREDAELIKSKRTFVEECVVKYADGDEIHALAYVWLIKKDKYNERVYDEWLEDDVSLLQRGLIVMPGSLSELCKNGAKYCFENRVKNL